MAVTLTGRFVFGSWARPRGGVSAKLENGLLGELTRLTRWLRTIMHDVELPELSLLPLPMRVIRKDAHRRWALCRQLALYRASAVKSRLPNPRLAWTGPQTVVGGPWNPARLPGRPGRVLSPAAASSRSIGVVRRLSWGFSRIAQKSAAHKTPSLRGAHRDPGRLAPFARREVGWR